MGEWISMIFLLLVNLSTAFIFLPFHGEEGRRDPHFGGVLKQYVSHHI